MIIQRATLADAPAILALQHLAYQREAALYNDYTIPPLTQTLAELHTEMPTHVVLKAVIAGIIIGSVRATMHQDTCHIGRLMVHPTCQRQGIGTRLLHEIERYFAPTHRYELFTGARSEHNIRLYQRLGYTPFKEEHPRNAVALVFMEKYSPMVNTDPTNSSIQEYHQGEFTISTDKHRLDRTVIHTFLQTAYWSKNIPREVVDKAIAHSLCFGVYHATAQVGFARLITDYATFAYLADVFILPTYRGRGLGKWLVQCMLAHPDCQGLRRWLLTTWDAHGLYQQHSFQPINHPEWFLEIVVPDIYTRAPELPPQLNPQDNLENLPQINPDEPG